MDDGWASISADQFCEYHVSDSFSFFIGYLKNLSIFCESIGNRQDVFISHVRGPCRCPDLEHYTVALVGVV
jgi:hypothetical protein